MCLIWSFSLVSPLQKRFRGQWYYNACTHLLFTAFTQNILPKDNLSDMWADLCATGFWIHLSHFRTHLHPRQNLVLTFERIIFKIHLQLGYSISAGYLNSGLQHIQISPSTPTISLLLIINVLCLLKKQLSSQHNYNNVTFGTKTQSYLQLSCIEM